MSSYDHDPKLGPESQTNVLEGHTKRIWKKCNAVKQSSRKAVKNPGALSALSNVCQAIASIMTWAWTCLRRGSLRSYEAQCCRLANTWTIHQRGRQGLQFIGIRWYQCTCGVSFLVIRRWFAQFLLNSSSQSLLLSFCRTSKRALRQHSKHRMRNVPIGSYRPLTAARFKLQVDFLEDHAFFARSDRCISGFVVGLRNFSTTDFAAKACWLSMCDSRYHELLDPAGSFTLEWPVCFSCGGRATWKASVWS